MISATQRAHIRPVHPFPARMAPSIVWDSLPDADRPLRVLDPMSGSGTTLVCAKAKGHLAIGCDTDPLALLIAQTWCADTDTERLKRRALLVLERAQTVASHLTLKESYPRNSDTETHRFIDFWFDPENRRQLAALATCISRVRPQTERTLLWCAFSRLIVTKSAGASLAMDVSHGRPHRAFEVAPIKPFDKFVKAVKQVLDNCPFSNHLKKSPTVQIRRSDARSLPFKTASIDMIITSPPYLNAIDYLRAHKLSLVWMGHSISEIRALRSRNIGTEVIEKSNTNMAINKTIECMTSLESLDNRSVGMIRRYACDMDKVMKECARVLKTGSKALFVVGDSAIRGVFVKNSNCLIHLGKRHGLALVSCNTRALERGRRYLPPPESEKAGCKMQTRMREESILQFVRD